MKKKKVELKNYSVYRGLCLLGACEPEAIKFKKYGRAWKKAWSKSRRTTDDLDFLFNMSPKICKKYEKFILKHSSKLPCLNCKKKKEEHEPDMTIFGTDYFCPNNPLCTFLSGTLRINKIPFEEFKNLFEFVIAEQIKEGNLWLLY